MFTHTDEEFYPIPGVLYVAKKRIYRFMGWPIFVAYIG